MITILVTLFVLISLGLVITVPVTLATPGAWESKKESYIGVFQTWISFVLLIAGIDGIASVR